MGSFATIESVDIRNGTVLGELASYSTIATNEAGFLSAFVEPKKGHVFANCLEKQNTEVSPFSAVWSVVDVLSSVERNRMSHQLCF